MQTAMLSHQFDQLGLIERDSEGYLLYPDDWNEELAFEMASEEDFDLDDERFEMVKFVRDHYEQNASVPEARTALKYMKQHWGPERATRKYLYRLFPGGYAQQACKFAGMRKPLKLMLDL